MLLSPLFRPGPLTLFPTNSYCLISGLLVERTSARFISVNRISFHQPPLSYVAYTNSFTLQVPSMQALQKWFPASLCWRISDMICKFVPMCQLLFISLLPEIFMCWSQILCLLPVADQIPDFHLNWWLITGSFLYMIDRCILLVSAPLISIHWRVALLPVARIRMCAWAVMAQSVCCYLS